MNLAPITRIKGTELYQLTTDTTECPYNIVKENPTKQYFYDMNYKDEPRKSKKRKNREFQERTQKVMNVSQGNYFQFYFLIRKRVIRKDQSV